MEINDDEKEVPSLIPIKDKKQGWLEKLNDALDAEIEELSSSISDFSLFH